VKLKILDGNEKNWGTARSAQKKTCRAYKTRGGAEGATGGRVQGSERRRAWGEETSAKLKVCLAGQYPELVKKKGREQAEP